MKLDSIIFDLDGTLWDSTVTSSKIWTKIVGKYREVTDEITADKLKKLFGKPLSQIGEELFTSVDRKRAIELINECCEKQNPFIAKEGGILYADLEDTLEVLSKKYKLCIVSNCEAGYIESFFEAHNLGKYFVDYECPGRTRLYKADNIKLVVERNQLLHPIYVGDTLGDAMASKAAGLPFVCARYGFGSVTDYDYVIDSLKDLQTLVQNI